MEKGVLGVWAEAFQDGILWRIRVDGNQNYVLEVSQTGSQEWIYVWDLAVSTTAGETMFGIVDAGYKKSYRIDDNGDLAVFDDRGYIAAYKRVG